MKIKEHADEEKGLFTLTNEGAGNSYILARPEYIRTTSKLDIRAVRPSAMGSSKEAKKLTLVELSNHALAVNLQQTQSQQPPIWDMDYLETQIAEAYEIPSKKAIKSQQKGSGNTAQEAIRKVAAPYNQGFKDKTSFQQQQPSTPPVNVPSTQSEGMVQQAT